MKPTFYISAPIGNKYFKSYIFPGVILHKVIPCNMTQERFSQEICILLKQILDSNKRSLSDIFF